MTRIALTTKYSAHNYGAMLQTYALQKKINDLGGDCFVVDADRKQINWILPWNSPNSIISNVFYYLHKKELKTGEIRFENFINDFPLSTHYENYDELLYNPPAADVFLTGSDQVWNPLDVQENYFLRYAPANKVRASYAASMGISYIPVGAKRIWGEYLEDIDYISVRESSAKQCIKDTYDKEAQVHVDPTLLLNQNEWEEISNTTKYNRPYIFCYVLYRPPWLNKWLKKLHKETGKDILTISSEAYRNIYHTKMIRDAGPKEMLGWLRNADFVISSSYHGVALSIANRKPFYAVVNPDAPARIRDMLQMFGLEDRNIDSDHTFDLAPIDYEPVKDLQKKKQEEAYQYLAFLISKPSKISHTDQELRKHEKLVGNIERVGKKCTGCTVCANICPVNAIKMEKNDEGFVYPVVDNSICIKCAKCLSYCHTVV